MHVSYRNYTFTYQVAFHIKTTQMKRKVLSTVLLEVDELLHVTENKCNNETKRVFLAKGYIANHPGFA